VWLTLARSRIELQKDVLHLLVELHDGCLIAAPIAIVWCAEDGDDVAIVAPIEPLHDELMGSADERQAVVVVELV